MCPTFGRPQHILEETVHSFLQQDYRGEKELVLLNDFDRQIIHFEHPEVRVVNVSTRFSTLGDKRNALAALCLNDFLCVWDDDDIYLPHRLTYSIAMYETEKRFFKPSLAFLLNGTRVGGPAANLFHGAAMWHRSLLDEVGGYRNLNCGEDMALELDFERVIGADKNYDEIKPSDIYYLYRWEGTGSYHLSGFGEDVIGQSGTDKVLEFVTHQIDQCLVPTGDVELQPRWRFDYGQIAQDYTRSLEG
jgi:glycosyltransferase involved in cell wall biosynthesis